MFTMQSCSLCNARVRWYIEKKSEMKEKWRSRLGARAAFSDRYSENLCAQIVVVAVILGDVRRILRDICSRFFYSVANSRRTRRLSRIGEIASAELGTKRLSWLVKPRYQNWFRNWKRYLVSEKVPRRKTTASIGKQSNDEAKCVDPWMSRRERCVYLLKFLLK